MIFSQMYPMRKKLAGPISLALAFVADFFFQIAMFLFMKEKFVRYVMSEKMLHPCYQDQHCYFAIKIERLSLIKLCCFT